MKDWKKISKITASYLILLLAVYFLLMPNGILQEYFGLDFSFLAIPLVVSILLLLSSRLIMTLAEQNWAKGLSMAVDGLAMISFVYIFFEANPPFFSDYRQLSTFAVLTAIGVTVARARNLIRPEGFRHVLSGAGVIIIGYALWQASLNLSGDIGEFHLSLDRLAIGPLKIWEGRLDVQFGLVDFQSAFFAGLIVVAAALVLSYGAKSENVIVRDLSSWLYKSQLRNFLIGFLFGLYLLTLRPIFAVIFPPIQLFEWGIAGFIVSRAYSGFKSEVDKKYTISLSVAPWTKHIQKITYRKDEDFEALKEIQEVFVDLRDKGPLMLYLTLLLSRNGFSIDQINQLLNPLIYYSDEKIPLIAFGWEKRRIIKKNRKRREQVLRNLMERLSLQLDYHQTEVKEVAS